MNSDRTDSKDRSLFEDRLFSAYFIKGIERTGRGGPLELAPRPDVLDKATLCKRKEDGTYERDEVCAMWYGWQLYRQHLWISGTFFSDDGTLMSANPKRSVFDDVDR